MSSSLLRLRAVPLSAYRAPLHAVRKHRPHPYNTNTQYISHQHVRSLSIWERATTWVNGPDTKAPIPKRTDINGNTLEKQGEATLGASELQNGLNTHASQGQHDHPKPTVSEDPAEKIIRKGGVAAEKATYEGAIDLKASSESKKASSVNSEQTNGQTARAPAYTVTSDTVIDFLQYLAAKNLSLPIAVTTISSLYKHYRSNFPGPEASAVEVQHMLSQLSKTLTVMGEPIAVVHYGSATAGFIDWNISKGSSRNPRDVLHQLTSTSRPPTAAKPSPTPTIHTYRATTDPKPPSKNTHTHTLISPATPRTVMKGEQEESVRRRLLAKLETLSTNTEHIDSAPQLTMQSGTKQNESVATTVTSDLELAAILDAYNKEPESLDSVPPDMTHAVQQPPSQKPAAEFGVSGEESVDGPNSGEHPSKSVYERKTRGAKIKKEKVFYPMPVTADDFVVIDNKPQMKFVVRHIRDRLRLERKSGNNAPTFLALDLEGDRFELRGKPGKINLHLLQLGTNEGVWIFDAHEIGAGVVCEALKPLLENERITKLVHDVHNDSPCLLQRNVRLTGVFDTQVANSVVHNDELSLSLSGTLHKYGINHPTKMAIRNRNPRWDKRPLDAQMLEYAASDVALLLRLGKAMYLDLVQKSVSLPGSSVSATTNMWEVAARASQLRVNGTFKHKIQRQVVFDTSANHALRDRSVMTALHPNNIAVDPYVTINDDDVKTLLQLLPEAYLRPLIDPNTWKGLTDIVMDVGRRPTLTYGSERVYLFDSPIEPQPHAAHTTNSHRHAWNQSPEHIVVTKSHIEEVVDRLGGKQKFGSDNRAGTDGSLHRISALRSRSGEILGLTCRVGKTITGGAHSLSDVLLNGNKSILVLGAPGSGKTALIREIARILSQQSNVLVVDTSNEIAGDGDVPHKCIGHARRVQVPGAHSQDRLLIEVVQNHTPQVIVIDEIGRANEVHATRTVKQRGVRMIASAHGDFRKLQANTQLSGLLGRTADVILPKGVHKTCRVESPTFDLVVELKAGVHDECVVIHNTADAVDNILNEQRYRVERRYRCRETGNIRIKLEMH